jgi:hypothetical protein
LPAQSKCCTLIRQRHCRTEAPQTPRRKSPIHPDALAAAELQPDPPSPARGVDAALRALQRLMFDVNERPVQSLPRRSRPDRCQNQTQLSRGGRGVAKVWVGAEPFAPFH